MDYANTAISKLAMVIVVLSVLIGLGAAVFFHINATHYQILPFAVGVMMAMVLNIVKIFWLKKAVISLSHMDNKKSAVVRFQIHYFLRLVLTAVVFLIAVLLPDNIINFFGVVFGIFTLPIATKFIRFFIPTPSTSFEMPASGGVVNDAVAKLESIGRDEE